MTKKNGSGAIKETFSLKADSCRKALSKEPGCMPNVIKIKDSADLKIESALFFVLMTLRTRSHVFLFYQKPKMYMNAPCGLVPVGLPASFSVCWKKSRDTVLSEKE